MRLTSFSKSQKRGLPTLSKIDVVKINPGAAGGYPYKREQPADIFRARSELGYEPEFGTFEKAIEDYAEWIRVNGF